MYEEIARIGIGSPGAYCFNKTRSVLRSRHMFVGASALIWIWMKDMTPSWINNPSGSASASASTSQPSGENILRLVAWREISPRVKRPLKRLWGEAARWSVSCVGARCEVTDARDGLIAWVETESLRHCSAKYCPLVPPPRSTIAAAFSSDGNSLASTHGDHTVKIIYSQTGNCLKVLSGHRRTPWVVRFHPLRQEILASGSLDHEVRLWDANTAECIVTHDFYRPIASIAFHAQGDLLAIASGHKLYIWQYNDKGDAASPMIVLRTRRSLRAVHFHPHAAPFLLTAEVNDLDAPGSPMTPATSTGYLQYPPPAVFFTPVHPGNPICSANSAPLMPFPCFLWPDALVNENNMRVSWSDTSMIDFHARNPQAENKQTLQSARELDLQTWGIPREAPADVSCGISHSELFLELVNPNAALENMVVNRQPDGPANDVYESGVEMLLRAAEVNVSARGCQSTSLVYAGELEGVRLSNQTGVAGRVSPEGAYLVESFSSRLPARQEAQAIGEGPVAWHSSSSMNVQLFLRGRHLQRFLPVGDQPGWEFAFLQGWVMGQTQAGLNPLLSTVGGIQGMETLSADVRIPESHRLSQNHGISLASAAMAAAMAATRVSGRSARCHCSRSRMNSHPGVGVGLHIGIEGAQPSLGTAQAAAAQAVLASAAAAAAAELPCTVKLRIWPYDIKNPSALLDPETCRLTIPHAVLCSEMGAHFSPCGRFLAACVVCVLPQQELEAGMQSQSIQGFEGMSTSPTRHPISARHVVYELRIYSLEEATFGEVLASRAIRAAHCLTSIQFSPTSAHILLAYGRRHNSLLRSILVDGTTTSPIYTILEIYRVSDMQLVRVFSSAEDEVNVACFHPLVGGGLVYGTKEGKLRMLQYNKPSHVEDNFLIEQNVLEVR